MQKRRVVLTYPYKFIDQPIISYLVKKYDIVVNILRAKINPKEEGRLVLEVSGKEENLDRGIDYLKELGLKIQSLAQDIRWLEDRCIQCTACSPLCPTGAIEVDRKKMTITFNKERCIACGLCIPACSYKAIEILF
ncbi:MAG: NIL domain-containing protein [Candidatus Aerophobetes bacterium]|nr:NIL domain-containing protein [Candidatus Aerophobetes bacterium]